MLVEGHCKIGKPEKRMVAMRTNPGRSISTGVVQLFKEELRVLRN